MASLTVNCASDENEENDDNDVKELCLTNSQALFLIISRKFFRANNDDNLYFSITFKIRLVKGKLCEYIFIEKSFIRLKCLY